MEIIKFNCNTPTYVIEKFTTQSSDYVYLKLNNFSVDLRKVEYKLSFIKYFLFFN